MKFVYTEIELITKSYKNIIICWSRFSSLSANEKIFSLIVIVLYRCIWLNRTECCRSCSVLTIKDFKTLKENLVYHSDKKKVNGKLESSAEKLDVELTKCFRFMTKS